jgi:hypothetical protein
MLSGVPPPDGTLKIRFRDEKTMELMLQLAVA